MSRLKALVADNPRLTTAAIWILVLAHMGLTQLSVIPSPWMSLQNSGSVSIYLGLAGSASLAAGSAGMVITLGMSGNAVTYQRFRMKTGQVLRRTWTSILVGTFSAAGLGLLAALATGIGAYWLSPWMLELGVLLVIHSAVRLVWLLRAMMNLLQVDDDGAEQTQRTFSLSEALRNRTAG